jgi:hypothetical protein
MTTGASDVAGAGVAFPQLNQAASDDGANASRKMAVAPASRDFDTFGERVNIGNPVGRKGIPYHTTAQFGQIAALKKKRRPLGRRSVAPRNLKARLRFQRY